MNGDQALTVEFYSLIREPRMTYYQLQCSLALSRNCLTIYYRSLRFLHKKTKRETNVLKVQQQFNKVQVLYSDNLVVFSLEQPLVAHTGKCLVTQTVQKLCTLAHDKEVTL